MASIFKPPYISSAQLSSLLVEDGQLVFNTDDKQFYTGNGTLGGRNIATNVSVPTKTSDLINDSGFISGKVDGDGTKFLSDDGTYKTIEVSDTGGESTEYSDPYTLKTAWLAAENDLSNLKVNMADSIILVSPITDNVTFGPLTIEKQGILDKVKTYQIWIPIKNPTATDQSTQRNYGMLINTGLDIIGIDNFPETLQSAKYTAENPPLAYRFFVFVIRCVPHNAQGDGIMRYSQYLNYSHYFDCNSMVYYNQARMP